MFGEGLGLGTFKLGFLSEVHTDFVLSGITEEIGLLGLGVICYIYLWMILRIFRIAGRCEAKQDFIFCSGIALLLLFFLYECFWYYFSYSTKRCSGSTFKLWRVQCGQFA